MSEPEPISLEKVKSSPLKERESKIDTSRFGRPWRAGGSLGRWIEGLPRILAGEDFRMAVERLLQVVESRKTLLLGMGAHAVKVGLNPVIIDLLERGILSGLAMNGACIIHDAEIAMVGRTSEDVAKELGRGRFGMAEETGRVLNEAIREGAKKGLGLGRSVGAALIEQQCPFNRCSLLARAYELDIPVTVHVALGTDIIHFHPRADGGAIGQCSHLDFRIFSRLVSGMEGGGYINLGSAVILPEVFLKALSLVRNLGYPLADFTTVDMDFIRQYRPLTNVVHRPTLEGGKGFHFTGHHEIMFPLLAAALIEGSRVEGSEKNTSTGCEGVEAP
jgi:hypothetical protein